MPSFLDLVGPIIGAGSRFIGGRTAARAEREAAAITEAAKARGVAAIREGSGAAIETLRPMAELAPVGTSYFRRIMAAPADALTPSQQIGRADLMRTATNRLAASGLRGAGRSGQAVLADADQRFMAGAYDTNQRRIDDAARTIEGRGAQGVTGTANLQERMGTSIGNVEVGAGTQMANRAAEAGFLEGTGQAQLGADIGGALGRLGGIFAEDVKADHLRDVGNAQVRRA